MERPAEYGCNETFDNDQSDRRLDSKLEGVSQDCSPIFGPAPKMFDEKGRHLIHRIRRLAPNYSFSVQQGLEHEGGNHRNEVHAEVPPASRLVVRMKDRVVGLDRDLHG